MNSKLAAAQEQPSDSSYVMHEKFGHYCVILFCLCTGTGSYSWPEKSMINFVWLYNATSMTCTYPRTQATWEERDTAWVRG